MKEFYLPNSFTIRAYDSNALSVSGICYLDHAITPGVSWGYGTLSGKYQYILLGQVTTERLMDYLAENYPDCFEFLLFHPELL